jgi:outer membrane PBP1 activator LpoA protein
LTRLTDDSERFLNALLDWRERFGNHPAASGILAERLAAQRGDGVRPTTIALLLPLSSAVRASAEAILEGFFAAATGSAAIGNSLSGSAAADRPAIRIYDTAQRGSAESFVTAQLEGADFIVGPLLTDEVAQVQAQAGFIPTLALNLGAAVSVAATNFFQFALAYDDEVDAIAARGIADGHRTAAILYASTDRGYEQRDRFRAAWESRGGTIINAIPYIPGSQNLSAPIEELLNIDQSEARHERLVANLGRTIQFEPRRRADIDMIFLQLDPATGNATARVLVPLLTENDADPEDIPTYSTRDVYDPTRRNGDPDLEYLIFPDVPLLIDPGGSAREAASRLAEFSTAAANQNRRFFAFGFDAFRLVEALYTRTGAGWPIPGATGDLYLGENGRIRRALPFAQFNGAGLPQALPPSVGQMPISGSGPGGAFQQNTGPAARR